ncbi:hypothetical protein KKC13_09895 [bacterium]|nr:hypothetical protein [bacterium]MBU1956958.1 hypothetical protein [bacterium]
MKTTIKMILISLIFGGYAIAGNYWVNTISDWKIQLDNGVAYIVADETPTHCSYHRAQINMDGTEYNRALYAKAKGKKITYVTNDKESICIITGLEER